VVGDTVEHVAHAAKQPRNSVANLRKVFSSPISALALQEAVDSESVSLTAAAQIIRNVEREPEVADILRRVADEKWTEEAIAENAVVQAARARVGERVRAHTGKPKSGMKPQKEPQHTPTTVEAPWHVDGDSKVLDCLYRFRSTRITVVGPLIRIEDLGRDAKGRTGAK
jgi:hypothetical protein